MLTVVLGSVDCDGAASSGSSSLIAEIVREGARRMLAEALQAEASLHTPDSPIYATTTESTLSRQRWSCPLLRPQVIVPRSSLS